MAWLAYTLAAAGLWGVGAVLAKKGLAQITPLMWLKEKVSGRQLLGIALAIGGVLILAV